LDFLINNKSVFKKSSLILTFLFSTLIFYYFKSKNTFFLLRLFVYEGIGIGFISFWIITLGLLVNIIVSSPYEIGVSCFFIIIILIIISLINGRTIQLQTLRLSSPKLKETIRLIFISDIHLGSNSITHLHKICSIIKNLDYDFIIIGGDLIDSSTFELNKLKIFKKLNKKIFFISGNHEYYLNNYTNKLEKLKNFNLRFLNNKSFILNNINIVGISDNQTMHSKSQIVDKLVDSELFNLIVVHKPDLWENNYKNTDLTLSGHTHKGQIFPFNFFVKFQFKHVYGLFQKSNSKLYVSSGCGCWGPKMRLGSRNEIVEIIITKQSL
tara:strand:- start:197 stop:1171 length:975 start_codon:yes stop_codon:yes gene_type:complete